MSAGTMTAGELRRAFDAAFAEAASPKTTDRIDVLLIEAGGISGAVRIGDLAVLVADTRIVAMPSSESHLLGLASIRDSLVTVYDLSGLLGHRAAERPRWIARIAERRSVGLAFDQVIGHVAVAGLDGQDIVRVERRSYVLISPRVVLDRIAGARDGATKEIS